MNERILLVEDDLPLAQWMVDYLTDQDYVVNHLSQGDQVIDYVKNNKVDVILLDWMLPKKDGLSICRELRALNEFDHISILMLTARDSETDEVLGLELGATDYLIKPIKPRVLLARIQKALRNRLEIKTDKTLELVFGNLSINVQANRVMHCKNEIKLTTTEFKLFYYLAKNAGCVLTRDQVFMEMKGREYDGFDRSLDVVISALRKHFLDDSQTPQKIKTIWGKGYLFVADAW